MIIQPLDYYLQPLRVASHLADQPDFAFLDSSDHRANYSIIALEPFIRCSFQKGKFFTESLIPGRQDSLLDWVDEFKEKKGDPFELLRKLLNRFQFLSGFSPFMPTNFPLPQGACLGYISYDLGAFLEAGVCPSQGFEDWPEMEWGFYDTLLIFDHACKIMTLISTGLPFSGEEQNRWAHHRLSSFLLRLEKIRVASKISDSLRIRSLAPEHLKGLSSNFSADSYQKSVQTIKDYIARGDVYQVNLSQQFYGETNQSGFELYQKIRRVNSVPYGGYLRFGQREILCFSMERFLRMEANKVQTRPIKGTIPRGRTIKEDSIQARRLWQSEKDRAELLMVVDMERNDLSKVCTYHSVRVDRLFEVEKYATVFHLVSTVSGRLRPEIDHLDCFRACFPGGSISGTPKIRAMEIITELEKIRRGVYCGALGYFGFNRVSDFNIPIRTILKQGANLWFNAGGGVVADSDPYLEYLETLHKVQSFLACLAGGQPLINSALAIGSKKGNH